MAVALVQWPVAVVGCGLMGMRRAQGAAAHPRTRLAMAVDIDEAAARRVADAHGSAWADDWRRAVDNPEVAALVVCTPNAWLSEITVAALRAGKHVLVEKPMGRSLVEAEAMHAAWCASRCVLKIGFNHRWHPALQRLHESFASGAFGRLVSLRARYGHGGRPGYEREWRGDPALGGGGELLDQGVHVVDLLQWIAGVPSEVFAFVQTAVWPVAPLEDNAWALLRFPEGAVASMHTSWTQWRNLFSLELHAEGGSLTVDGLGGSYGIERLTTAWRRIEGGVPRIEEVCFNESDPSWRLEWDDFVTALDGGEMRFGTPSEGRAVMRTVDALYRSAREGRLVSL